MAHVLCAFCRVTFSWVCFVGFLVQTFHPWKVLWEQKPLFLCLFRYLIFFFSLLYLSIYLLGASQSSATAITLTSWVVKGTCVVRIRVSCFLVGGFQFRKIRFRRALKWVVRFNPILQSWYILTCHAKDNFFSTYLLFVFHFLHI